ncbi:TraB/VirB10 family protein [Methylovulum psychrotolerans]|uniref:Conjugal transfer protein TraB n=1 Tax=Methylovulum psychrotolerans TaxID=1704499 RepID=A0A2S5CIR7_9GAMM|nr:TraB/VirB10 family protein [Methylovulum psychrotolerans]POZ50647.1 hypothetical protein AADEFJLK_03542 [Methylovulum psychrotolerans]
MNDLMKRLAEFYGNLDPKKKQQIMLLGGGGIIFLLSAIIIVATSENGDITPTKKPRKIEYNLFNGKDPREVSLDALAAKVKGVTQDLTEIRLSYQQQDKKTKEIESLLIENNRLINEQNTQIKQRYDELEKRVANTQEVLQNQVPLPPIPGDHKSTGPNARPEQNGFEPASKQPPNMNDPDTGVDTGLKIRVISGFGEEGKKTKNGGSAPAQTSTMANSTELAAKRQQRNRIMETVNIKRPDTVTGLPDVYLPSGTMLSGVLMTGLDAPTSNQSRMDPFPTLLRVKHEALLPNKYRMDIAECFVIASGYGDLSSERAYMRAERLSCVKKDGTVIETPMDAYSVGEDGKAGVRGRLVSKNGQVIGNALLAGFVSGLGKAFTPQRVQPLALNPSGTSQFQYPSPEAVGGQAIGGGVHSAADQLAAYYLEMAKNIFPVIEVDAGRSIDLILVRGMSLTGKSRSTAVLPDRVTNTTYGPVTKHHGTYGAISGSSSGLMGTISGFSGTGNYR